MDYSKVGAQGFQISQQAGARAQKKHDELKSAFAATEQQRATAQQQMLQLPPEAAAVMSAQLEQVMNDRAKAIMGGSSLQTSQSGQAFQDLAMSAAKISSVNKDLVAKYEQVRKSEEYMKNKTAYDAWYNESSRIIADSAMGGLDGAAQLDFFQPPVLQPDIDIVTRNVQVYKNNYNPADYQVVTQSGLTTTTVFDEAKAKVNAVQQTADLYNDANSETFTDLNYATTLALHPELQNDPEAIMAIGSSMAEAGGMEDRLSELNISSNQDIDALNVPASEKRELKSALRWVNERNNQMELHAQQLVESVRFRDQKRTAQGSSSGKNPKDDFGRNFGSGTQVVGATQTALSNAGYTTGQKFGFASTKGGTRKQVGSGQNMMYYEGILYDGTDYKALVYKPTPGFLAQITAGTNFTEDELAAAILDPSKFEQAIVAASSIKGDIPSGDYRIMESIAEEEYLNGL